MAITVTTGGVTSGYCEIGSTRMAAMPASAMKIERTAAKIGRSMKKRLNMVSPYFFLSAGLTPSALGGAGLAPSPLGEGWGEGDPGGGAFGSPTCTVAPGKTFINPSTMTLSPAARPEVTTQSSPTHSPTVMGFGTALLSGPST